MSIAKITSLFGGLIYLVIFTSVLLFGKVIGQVFSQNFGVENQSLSALILASAFFVAVINFCFSYFIQWQQNYHENLDNAFFVSLQLLIVPAILFIGYIVVFANLN